MRTEAGTNQSSHKPRIPGAPRIQERQEGPSPGASGGSMAPGGLYLTPHQHPDCKLLASLGMTPVALRHPACGPLFQGHRTLTHCGYYFSLPPWRSLSPFCRRCVVPCKKQGTSGPGGLLPAPRFSDPCFSNGIYLPPHTPSESTLRSLVPCLVASLYSFPASLLNAGA